MDYYCCQLTFCDQVISDNSPAVWFITVIQATVRGQHVVYPQCGTIHHRETLQDVTAAREGAVDIDIAKALVCLIGRPFHFRRLGGITRHQYRVTSHRITTMIFVFRIYPQIFSHSHSLDIHAPVWISISDKQRRQLGRLGSVVVRASDLWSRDCQACHGYEISHPYPYPQIFAWISMDIAISTDAYPVYMRPLNFHKTQQGRRGSIPKDQDSDIPLLKHLFALKYELC